MKQKITLQIVLIFLLQTAYSQTNLIFNDLSDMILQRGLITTSSNSTSLFVSHGFSPDENYTVQIEKYDFDNNQWTILANSITGKRYASSEIVGNYLYIFNGITETSHNEKLERINITSGNITFLSDNPYPVRNAGNCAWGDNLFFFGGKNESGYSNKLLKYDLVADQWTILADMEVGRETSGEVVDGKIYAIGGYNGSVSTRIDVYDIQTNSWEHKLDIPNGISAHSTAANDRKIWIIGDYTNQTNIGFYDIVENEYISCTSQNMIGRRHFGAEIVNNKLFIMGGNQTSQSTSALNSLQFANLSSVSSVLEKKLNLLEIYPNPCSNNISISFPEKIQELSIIDLQGKKVKRFFNLKAKCDINISELTKGTYFVFVKSDKLLISKSVIKN